MTALSVEGFGRRFAETNLCGSIPVVIDALPIVPGADSTWRGEIYPGNILECAPPGSPLDGFPTRPPKPGSNSDGPARVTFRRHPDGRVTFDARTTSDRSRGIVVQGERISTELYQQ